MSFCNYNFTVIFIVTETSSENTVFYILSIKKHNSTELRLNLGPA